jgi:heme/copper-type cytochrome/quinol oxidase subunit 2
MVGNIIAIIVYLVVAGFMVYFISKYNGEVDESN